MTSELETLKTNEFLRRRKLRLQQVREQSKDIAKKLRQRAKVERLRQECDSKKEREYLLHQEKLVKRLEQLYAQGVKSVGESHNKASEVVQNEVSPDKSDLSRFRGKEAVAELRRKRQEKLDEQKKLLDRKLLARAAANEISREKSSTVANKLLARPSTSKFTEETDKATNANAESNLKENVNAEASKLNKNDMATQWEFEEMPNEWEPNIPALSLPKDDKESLKDSNNAAESKSDKSKRLDLFALSSEMPSSLRGGVTNVPEEQPAVKPSLTMVSEYLQNRALRLREPDTTGSSKRTSDDLHNLKQTILRTRSSKIEGKGGNEKSTASSSADPNLNKKNSVTMYNHSTKDSRDVPCADSGLVVRDVQNDDDAYSQALRESKHDNSKEKEHQKKLQEMRSKVAMTKQTVEKEYNDTMSFLKTLPKEKCTKHMKNAHMDERRQQILKMSRQQKLQHEFNKIEKECRRNCVQNARARQTPEKPRNKSKSPARDDLDEDFDTRDLQYSWMPVPESDGSLAIHTIPTTLKEGKTGNTVKFSKVDSYHEYRSRHKHTPPTKDTNHERPAKRLVETVLIHKDGDDSTDCSSITSDTSSVGNLNLEKRKDKQPDQSTSEAERVIVYKILESKLNKSEKKKKKLRLIDDVAKALKSMNTDNTNKTENDNNNNEQEKLINGNSDRNEMGVQNTASLDQLKEGIYKVVNEKGDNITSLYFSDKPQKSCRFVLTDDELKSGRPCCCHKQSSNYPQSDKGTNLHCGNGDISKRNTDCLGCKCGCTTSSKAREMNTSDILPSTATSTSSFKTAKNDKALGALPDGGYIKLIDDDGQEAGKFYIGASGFLRDDAYEVIIQLRKKDLGKKESEKESESSKIPQENAQVQEPIVESKEKQPINEVYLEEQMPDIRDIHMNDVIEVRDKSSEIIIPRPPSTSKISNESESNKSVVHMEKNSSDKLMEAANNDPINNRDRPKQYVEKGVYTTDELSYAIPNNVPKTDPISRPATSTYTQTSMESPIHRPVLMHMSSSTSTAYMSPPEMVLPKYFKQGYDVQGEQLKQTDKGGEHCRNEKCKTKRCKCRKIKSLTQWNKPDSAHKILNTPPNTARNIDESSGIWDQESEAPVRKIHSKKCHKFEPHKQCHGHKNKKDAPRHKISSRNLVMRVTSSTASTLKNKYNKGNKSDLNPVIKTYVNKLLELNREGIKAIEVADQECSSVTTPGSSIVEVPTNINIKESNMQHKISLEQMKNVLKQKILEEYVKESTCNNSAQTLCSNLKLKKSSYKLPKKRSVHKVKSLNISKRLSTTKKQSEARYFATSNMKSNPSTTSPFSARDFVKNSESFSTKTHSRCKSSPTPRPYFEYQHKNIKMDSHESTLTNNTIESNQTKSRSKERNFHQNKPGEFAIPYNKATTTSADSEANVLHRQKSDDVAANISTQTSQDLDSEINLMRMAEDKLQNMEKIADLTEKCTKRLSNLAKVLEEVRRNKSLAYSQISTSDTASDSEHKSDKNIYEINLKQSSDLNTDMPDKTEPKHPTPPLNIEDGDNNLSNASEFIPFLTNIPKPVEFKYPATPNTEKQSNIKQQTNSLKKSETDNMVSKNRGKPPPALSRMHLKYGHDIVPHELSTVIEVDSPMSVKLKNSSRTNTKCEVSDLSYKNNNVSKDQKKIENLVNITSNTDTQVNPDLLQSNNNINISKLAQKKISSTDSSDDSKVQMMDLKQFNELMLKPFISIQEFAKQCDIGMLDDGSNLEDNPKEDNMINDEMSSLHSDGSLPDVIAELLKRNIITEPFKFDSVSNVNSSTVSSESTLSVLALSKVRKEKKKSSVVFQNKENVSETSDTLSISSNPDLENAFKKLGMGWASSTLKKTKERLALSSSSNTSSSSLSQFKLKSLNNQDTPALVTDSVSSVRISRKIQHEKDTFETSKNAEQQTSFMNSMTVKEFLTNELAKKITFTNKSNRNDTEEEFVSLFETKMPDEMKHTSHTLREECSVDSVPGGNNNRARTSTPVQIFKSMTYHSSSSSNISNGLFSNADDLSSVKVTSNSIRNHSTSDKDDLTIPNCSLKTRKGASDCSKSE